jgi:GTPase SAR1 family protein
VLAVGGRALAIVGDAGSGKSTTAAAFVQRGYQLLSDDIAAVGTSGNRVMVMPGYPRLNLWPDAGHAVFEDSSLPRLTPAAGINDWWDKRYRELKLEEEFHSRPLPLAALYVLGERRPEHRLHVQRLSMREAFIAVADCTYVTYALDEAMRGKEFSDLGKLVRRLPTRWVERPEDIAHLPDLCDSILEDYRHTTGMNTAA